MEKIALWQGKETPYMTVYEPQVRKGEAAVVIFPGGGYVGRAEHEGKGYAEFLNSYGILAFVVEYRVFPDLFPAPLEDAQRAVQLVRYYSDKYGVNKEKIAVMGSSAGAHLAAAVSTYRELASRAGDDISKESFTPDAQILCYGVLDLVSEYAHKGSGEHLLGNRLEELGKALSPALIADEHTPKAFLWHTLEDPVVPVENSLAYAKRLREVGVSCELHIFPDGFHGLGLCIGESKYLKHNSQWGELLIKWLEYIDFKES